MIPVGTTIRPADNAGAKRLEIVGIPGAGRKRFAGLGDVVTCAVKGASSTGVVKDHSLVRVVIVRAKKETRRKDGSYIRFGDNAGIVVDENKNMLGTRVFGPVARELRERGYSRIISLAKEVW
jgi:large subunit ribosomal protein L14